MNYLKELFNVIFSSLVSWYVGSEKLIENRVIITSTRNIYYNFNSKYFFEYLINNPKIHGFDVYYVINDPIKRTQLNEIYNTDRFIQTTSLTGIFFV